MMAMQTATARDVLVHLTSSTHTRAEEGHATCEIPADLAVPPPQ